MARSIRHDHGDDFCASSADFGYECYDCGQHTRTGSYVEDYEGFTDFVCSPCGFARRSDISRMEVAA